MLLLCALTALIAWQLILRARRLRREREAKALHERIRVILVFASRLLAEHEVAGIVCERLIQQFAMEMATEVWSEAQLLYDLCAEVARDAAAEVAAEKERKQRAAELHAASVLQAVMRGKMQRRRGLPLVALGTVERRKKAFLNELDREPPRSSRDLPLVALGTVAWRKEAFSNDLDREPLRSSQVSRAVTLPQSKLGRFAMEITTAAASAMAKVAADAAAAMAAHEAAALEAVNERHALETRKAKAATRISAGWRRRQEVRRFGQQLQAATRIQQRILERHRKRAEAAAIAAAEKEELLAWGRTQTRAVALRAGLLSNFSRAARGFRGSRRTSTGDADGSIPSRREALARVRREKAEHLCRAQARGQIIHECARLALAEMERSGTRTTFDTALSASLERLLAGPTPWEVAAITMADGGRASQSLSTELQRREEAQPSDADAHVAHAPSPAGSKACLMLVCQPVSSGCRCWSVKPPQSTGHRLWSLLLTLIDEAKPEAEQLQLALDDMERRKPLSCRKSRVSMVPSAELTFFV